MEQKKSPPKLKLKRASSDSNKENRDSSNQSTVMSTLQKQS